jgi:hypothetical protein
MKLGGPLALYVVDASVVVAIALLGACQPGPAEIRAAAMPDGEPPSVRIPAAQPADAAPEAPPTRATPVALSCSDDRPSLVSGLQPTAAVSHVELRQTFKEDSLKTLEVWGEACALAASVADCEAELVALPPSPTEAFRWICRPECYRHHLVFSGTDGVGVIGKVDELKAWLGAIDTPSEALLLAWADGYDLPGCGELAGGKLSTVSDGYELMARKMTRDCSPIEVSELRLRIAKDGSIEVKSSTVVSQRDSCH